MAVSVYDILQGIIVTSLVTSSGIYVIATFLSKSPSKFYLFVGSFLKLDRKKQLIQKKPDQPRACTLCSTCTGCPLESRLSSTKELHSKG